MEMANEHPDSMTRELVVAGDHLMILEQPSETNNFKERMR